MSFPLFGPWGSWYPWYGSGFGWNLGFVTYDPWRYGATSWLWGRYGFGYDPYDFAPYDAYDPYFGDVNGPGSARFNGQRPAPLLKGSVRVRADPSTAKVYVDGALAGTVDDFNGLTHHLELEAGTHQLEIRADGYQNYSTQITIETGKTITARASLKKR